MNGKPLGGAARQAWETIFSFSVITNKAIHLPPGTPDDIVKAYRDAARSMLADPEFQAFRKKNLGQYRQYVGEEGKVPLRTATNWSKEGRAYIVEFLKSNYDVDL